MRPDKLPRALRKFRADPDLASVSLRLIPEGRSFFSRLQDIEYAMGRAVFCRYMLSQRKLRCVSGAAGMWRRKVLQEVLGEHSGRHNGDDFEATAIAMRMGHTMAYEKSIVVETFAPQNPRDFFRQRSRWELGALETYEKENRFYLGQIRDLRSKLGHVTIFDWYTWLTALTLPLFLVNGLLNHAVFEVYAIVQGSLTATAGYLSRNEVRSRRDFMLLPIFPFYTFFATTPRFAAIYRFLRERKERRMSALPPRALLARPWPAGGRAFGATAALRGPSARVQLASIPPEAGVREPRLPFAPVPPLEVSAGPGRCLLSPCQPDAAVPRQRFDLR